jgi:hypothetical protein
MKPAPRLTSPGTSQAASSPISEASSALLSNLILARASLPDGATKAELTRDLRPLILSDIPAAQWRELADELVATLMSADLLTQTRTRFAATPSASPQVVAMLGSEPTPKATWSDVRDGALTARALNLDPADRATLKALASPDGFRALIVQQAFGVGDGPCRFRSCAMA